MSRFALLIIWLLLTAIPSSAQGAAPCPHSDASAADLGTSVPDDSHPDISGTWRLDRDRTTADLRWNKTDRIVVRQSEEDIRIQYFRDRQLLGTEMFITDWVERPRYKTRIERAYARVRWEEDELLIRTRSFLDAEGYQSYTMEDRWELSEGGETLTDKGSDGKLTVFYRISAGKRCR